MKSVPAAIRRLRRTTWKPDVRDEDGSSHGSKFGGTPWLRHEESWPNCQHCGKPMPLFLQLNLAALPEPLRGEFGPGLLQLFYCISEDPSCETECDAFFPFTPGKLVRIIQSEGTFQPEKRREAAQAFPSKRIIGWRAEDDYPNWEECAEYGLTLSDKEWDKLAKQGFPRAGDKMAGWPLWVQRIEYPLCPICHERMRFVFQIDSNDHIPYMFGDLGCGHITQCPTHTTQVTFAWACS